MQRTDHGSGRVQVKICGLRTPEDLTAAEGADLVGVVVEVEGSPRRRSVAQARDLFRRAEGRYTRVAVVVSPTLTFVRHLFEEAGPDLVQIHGALPPGLTLPESRRIVPSVAISERDSAATPPGIPSGAFPWVHLDRGGGPILGGTGRTFPWEIGRAMVDTHPHERFLLGGGLTPENVGAAIREVRPQGVDVSSGVESRPGEKSRAKIEMFLAAARSSSNPTDLRK